ncbi:MAG: tetratricopeptide repeat protein [Acidobacteria bacterium]|nr:tetratricopeptide repeat protein [Acidobacteriota bacterium]
MPAETGGTGPGEIRLLIADFADNTADPDLAPRIKPVLHWVLQQSDRLVVYPEMKAARFLKENYPASDAGMTLSRARALCLREDIPVILLPGVNRLEGSLVVSAKIVYVEENREQFVDTLRVSNLDQLAITVENLCKRIRQNLGESWGSPAMTGDLFTGDTTFEILDLLSRSLSFYAYTSRPDAVRCLEEILRRDPSMAAARMHLGLLYLQLERPRDALLHISGAKDSCAGLPGKARYLVDGLHDFVRHRYQEAIVRFRSYAEAFPYDWQARSMLGLCAAAAGDYPAAIEQYRKAVSLDDTRIESRIGLGLGLLYGQDIPGARRVLTQASALAPDDPDVKIALGLLELVENNPRYAIEAFDETAKLPLYGSRSNMLLAQTGIYRGKFTDALQLLAAGIEDDRRNGDSYSEATKRLARARIFQHTGKTSDAAAECLRIPEAGGDPVLIAERGSVLAGIGRTAQAREMLEHLLAVSASPFTEALAAALQGEIQAAEGRFREALQSLKQAREYTKIPSPSLARLLMQTKQWEDAMAEFADIRRQKAAVLFPHRKTWFAGTWVQALYDAGRCSLESNRTEEAKQYFRQYLWVMESADPSLETPRKAEILLTGKSLK